MELDYQEAFLKDVAFEREVKRIGFDSDILQYIEKLDQSIIMCHLGTLGGKRLVVATSHFHFPPADIDLFTLVQAKLATKSIESRLNKYVLT